MKKFSVIFLLVIPCLLINCDSPDDPNANGNNTGGDVTITTVTPEYIYADDEITINGTGFSTVPSENLVEMGTSSGTFYAYQVSDPSDPDPTLPYFTVLSATSTQLVVKVKNETAQEKLNFEFYNDYPYRVRVTTKGKSGMGAIQHAKRLVIFHLGSVDVVNHIVGCLDYVQPGDSVHMDGSGFYGICNLTIDNKTIPVKEKKITELRFKVPYNQFGSEENCVDKFVNVKVTNGDGKSFEKEIHFAAAPPMVIFGASFDKTDYGPGSGTANLTVSGYCLYSSAMFRLNGPAGYQLIGSLNASSYASEVVVPFSLTSLQPGSYSVNIKKNIGADFGFPVASFTISE
ncbi:MAG: hypothetical protein ABI663_20470 [Chryseolinea sp.]